MEDNKYEIFSIVSRHHLNSDILDYIIKISIFLHFMLFKFNAVVLLLFSPFNMRVRQQRRQFHLVGLTTSKMFYWRILCKAIKSERFCIVFIIDDNHLLTSGKTKWSAVTKGQYYACLFNALRLRNRLSTPFFRYTFFSPSILGTLWRTDVHVDYWSPAH